MTLANNTDTVMITAIKQDDMVTSTLTLISPNYTQLLNYNCSATNPFGTQHVLANLTVEGIV